MKAWIDWDSYKYLLGTMTDGELSRRIGCALSTVHKKRAELGIASYFGKKKASMTWENYSCKVGFTMPMEVVRMVDKHYAETKEPRSRYIARLVMEDQGRKK